MENLMTTDDRPALTWIATATEGGRLLTRANGIGWVANAPGNAVELPGKVLISPTGTITLRLLALEDLDTCQRLPQHNQHLPRSGRYRLLSDQPDADPGPAHFALAWDNYWHPNLMVKFAAGFEPWEIHNTPARAFAGAGHFAFHANEWLDISVTWDHPAMDYRLYANGVLVGTSDTLIHHFGGTFQVDAPGEKLYLGNSAFAFAKLTGWTRALSPQELATQAQDGAPAVEPARTAALQSLYDADTPMPFAFDPDGNWDLRFHADFQEASDLEKFYLQGNAAAARVTGGALEVHTGGGPLPDHARFAEEHLYLWTEEFFDGDLYVEYEFMPLARGGLSLLILQASGMQREDFMACYPRRTTGSMSMVCWEDVRNYHWEYFREINDVRNDRISHGMIKNPWHRTMGFATRRGRYALNAWHRIQFLQEGNRLRAAVDGDCVLDLRDAPSANNGPILNCGRIALRTMARTEIAFRNVRAWNRKPS
jgi:hypothetical protein